MSPRRTVRHWLPLLCLCACVRGAELSEAEVRTALARATTHFRSLAVHGGYVWKVSSDGQQRQGEGKCTPSQIWVQPPGTPAVGQAFLEAWKASGDADCWQAALDAADALAWGQSPSGGWPYSIDFGEGDSRYLHRGALAGLNPKRAAKRRDDSVLDDDNTQSVLRFLLAVQQAGEGKTDARLDRARRALDEGLAALLRAQRPNGAWPQRFGPGFTDPPIDPRQKATLPATWPRERNVKDYHVFHTLNDQLHRDCIGTLLDAHRTLGRPEFLAAARSAGDFLLLAQLPEPQPGWAQQYTFEMQPAWARKFEPPALSSSESKGAVQALIDLYVATGEDRFLAPIPAALAWLRRSAVADNLWARFYELGSNRPLYFTREYALTHDDSDVPTHYSFKGEYGIPSLQRDYDRVRAEGAERSRARREPKVGKRTELAQAATKALRSLDAQGRWVEDGWIESDRFVEGVRALAEYLRAAP